MSLEARRDLVLHQRVHEVWLADVVAESRLQKQLERLEGRPRVGEVGEVARLLEVLQVLDVRDEGRVVEIFL